MSEFKFKVGDILTYRTSPEQSYFRVLGYVGEGFSPPFNQHYTLLNRYKLKVRVTKKYVEENLVLFNKCEEVGISISNQTLLKGIPLNEPSGRRSRRCPETCYEQRTHTLSMR